MMMSEGSDGSLSQDEIDALLQGTGDMDFDDASASASESLDNPQLAAFAAIMNSTVENQASNLAMLVSKSVTIGIPQVDQVSNSMLAEGMTFDLVQIKVNMRQGLSGEHGYILPSEVALAIAGPMMGLDGVELNDAAINALEEAMGNISGPILTVLGDKSGKTIMNDPPSGKLSNVTDLELPVGNLVRVVYPLTIDGVRIGTFIEYYSVPIVQAVTGQVQQTNNPAQNNGGGNFQNAQMGNQGNYNQMGNQGNYNQMGNQGNYNQMGNQGNYNQMGNQGNSNQMGMPSQSVQSVQFPNFQQGGTGGMEQGNIGLLMDVYMEVTVELGRTKKLIRDILGMGEGTIIELDKLAGEPVDILVNHKLIAKGEVVVIDENFGVRVTEIVSPVERMGTMS